MNASLNKYLNAKQYANICKYWNIIENLKYKLETFDGTEEYITYEEF